MGMGGAGVGLGGAGLGLGQGLGLWQGHQCLRGGYKDATKARNHRKLNVGVTIPIVSSLIEDTRPLKAPA